MAIATDKTFVSIVMLAAVMSIYMKNVRSPLDRVLHSRGIRVAQPFFSIWTVLPVQEGKFARRYIFLACDYSDRLEGGVAAPRENGPVP